MTKGPAVTLDLPKTRRVTVITREEHVAVRHVAEAFKQRTGVQLSQRTADFYYRAGLLKRPLPGSPGDKNAYWRQDYIFDELEAIVILRQQFGFPLSEIRQLAQATDYHLSRITTEIIGVEEIALDQARPLREKPAYSLDRFVLTDRIRQAYFGGVKRGTIRTHTDYRKFVDFVERAAQKYVAIFETQVWLQGADLARMKALEEYDTLFRGLKSVESKG